MGTKRFLAAMALLSMVTVADLAAQGNNQTRKGFWFGAGMGYGSLGCEGCGTREGGFSGYLKAGATVSNQVLLGFETNGWTKSQGGATLSSGNLSGALYLYPSPKVGFFMKGGAGIAVLKMNLAGFGGASDTGAGLLLGLGYDARVGHNVSLTPYFNLVGGSFTGGTANVAQFGLGVTMH